MSMKPREHSFLFGRFVIQERALEQLNLLDLYLALLRHALGKAVELCPVRLPTTKLSFWARQCYATAHQDRHGTAFWIVTEPDLSKTVIRLAND